VFVEERTVDVHIRRLRKALEPSGHDKHIETIRGSGYRFALSPLEKAPTACSHVQHIYVYCYLGPVGPLDRLVARAIHRSGLVLWWPVIAGCHQHPAAFPR